MKRFIAAILALLLLLALAACGASTPEPAPGPEPGGPDPKEDVPEPVPDEPPPAFATLGAFARDGELRTILPLDSGRALIMYGTVSDEEGPFEGYYILKLALFDVENDALLQETTVEGGFDEELLGVRKNGEILTFNWFTRELGIYSANLEFERAVSMPEEWPGTDLRFDSESDSLLYSTRNMIYEMPIDCSSDTLFAEFDENSYVSTFDPESALAVCMMPYTEEKACRELSVCSAADSSVMLTAETCGSEQFLHDGHLVMSTTRPLPDADGQSISYHTVAELYDMGSASSKALDLGSAIRASWENCIPYMTGIEYNPDGADVPVLIDLAAGKKTVLPIDGDSVFELRQCCFSETGRCLIAAISYDDSLDVPSGMGHIRLYSADPSRLEFTETIREEEPDSEEVLIRQRGENRKLLSSMADGIKEEFNVTVMFGDECLDVEQFGTHEFTSTDAGSLDQSVTVYRMLSNIRENLALYPEGYFDTFYDDEGEGGLQILVVLNPTDNYNPDFSLGGYTYQVYSTYYIVVDAEMNSTAEAIVPHEMWHAVEQRIWNDYAGAFDTYTWSEEYNPPDFEGYVNSLSTYEADSEKWDRYIMQRDGEEPYFYRTYSLVNDKEDRATLVETLFNNTLGDTPAASAEALREYPHMRAKLDFMAEQVREVFGTVYWEENAG